jgi:DNA-binding MarR family transcriptional regulator
MRSTAEIKILRWLGQFPPALESAWDITRELSLPGVAEALGVVRSSLNIPLKSLQKDNLVMTRTAHVIGGGSRRRSVFHITMSGRELLQQLIEEGLTESPLKKAEKRSKAGKILGPAPPLNPLYGRGELLSEIIEQLSNNSSVVISGLPGIGKTSLARKALDEMAIKGYDIHWASSGEFTDVGNLLSQWEISVDGVEVSDIDAVISLLNREKRVLFIDDVHMIHSRHIESIEKVSNALIDSDTKIFLSGREPMPFGHELTKIKVPSLHVSEATKLLGDEIEQQQKEQIAKRLGGHPLALLLYDEEAGLPEQGADVQQYVEEVVLAHLDNNLRDELDQLVIIPMPIMAESAPNSESIGLFDEYALLRWTKDNEKMEVQHLVRNVRRSILSEEALRELHHKAILHWQQGASSDEEKVRLLYHRVAADDENLKFHFEREVESLLTTQSAAISVVLQAALEVHQGDVDLHYMAAHVAIQRGEVRHAETHLEKLLDDSRGAEIALAISLQQGRISEAEELIRDGLELAEPEEKTRLALAAASRCLDDRIGTDLNPNISKQINQYLKKITLPKQPDKRTAVLISMSLIKHSVALLDEDLEGAAEIRKTLAQIGGIDNGMLLALEIKSQLIAAKNNLNDIRDVIDKASTAIEKQPSKLHSDALRMSLVESIIEFDSGSAEKVFNEINSPQKGHAIAAQKRLNARWWTMKSILNPSMAIVALREAISLNKATGCHHAAKQLTARLHKLL